jgi:hypothetical protein
VWSTGVENHSYFDTSVHCLLNESEGEADGRPVFALEMRELSLGVVPVQQVSRGD